MPAKKTIRVTTTDLLKGEPETIEIWDNFVLVCAGSAYLDSIQVHANGTVQLTIKDVKP